MAQDLSWIPETLKTLLQRSENHYRSVGFKRTANHMRQAYDAAVRGNVSPDFFTKYVKLLKDDAREFINTLGFDDRVKTDFTGSLIQSIDAVSTLLNGLDAEGKTPTFNGATSRKEDIEAINRYFVDNGGLFDPVPSSSDCYSALEKADPMYETVYSHVYVPGRDFLVAQLELALGRDRTLELVESILSVYGIIPKGEELVSDFRYAYQNPGKFSEDGKVWVITDKVTIPVDSFARWPIIMYYKVPIITAMLPVHNVIFFALVQETIARKKGIQ